MISGTMRAPRGFRRAVDQAPPFSMAVRTPWKTPHHNDVLGLEAALLAVRHKGLKGVTIRKTVPIFIDILVALCTLAKGCPSSHGLNEVDSPLAGQLLKKTLHFLLHCITSEVNLEERSSRTFN